MRFTQENQLFLDSYMKKLREALRMRLKFCNHCISSKDVAMMLLEYLDEEPCHKESPKSQAKIVASPKSPYGLSEEVTRMQEQLEIQAQLTTTFFEQMRKEPLLDENLFENSLKQTYYRTTPTVTIEGVELSSSREISPMPSPSLAKSARSFAPPKVSDFDPTPPLKMIGSFRTMHSTNTSASKVDSSAGTPVSKSKNKALSKLMNLGSLMKKEHNRRTKTPAMMMEQYMVDRPRQHEQRRLAEDNEALRAVNQNLNAHLAIMEKNRNVPSVQELVRREQALRKRENQLKELSASLNRRERSINKSHTECLQRRRSLRSKY